MLFATLYIVEGEYMKLPTMIRIINPNAVPIISVFFVIILLCWVDNNLCLSTAFATPHRLIHRLVRVNIAYASPDREDISTLTLTSL